MDKTLKEIQQEIVEEFSMYDEWLDKYAYLIDLGNNLETFPEELKTEDRLIKGCQSRVWLDATLQDGKLVFRADSDAVITKGIISLLVECIRDALQKRYVKTTFHLWNNLDSRKTFLLPAQTGLYP